MLQSRRRVKVIMARHVQFNVKAKIKAAKFRPRGQGRDLERGHIMHCRGQAEERRKQAS